MMCEGLTHTFNNIYIVSFLKVGEGKGLEEEEGITQNAMNWCILPYMEVMQPKNICSYQRTQICFVF